MNIMNCGGTLNKSSYKTFSSRQSEFQNSNPIDTSHQTVVNSQDQQYLHSNLCQHRRQEEANCHVSLGNSKYGRVKIIWPSSYLYSQLVVSLVLLLLCLHFSIDKVHKVSQCMEWEQGGQQAEKTLYTCQQSCSTRKKGLKAVENYYLTNNLWTFSSSCCCFFLVLELDLQPWRRVLVLQKEDKR